VKAQAGSTFSRFGCIEEQKKMAGNKRRYTPQFKAKVAMTALRGKYSIKEITSFFEIHPSLVHAWRKSLQDLAVSLFTPCAPVSVHNRRHRFLDRTIKRLRSEQEWMRRVAGTMELRERRACVNGGCPQVSILAQARLLNLHRSGIYYRKRWGGLTAGPESNGDSPPQPKI
jgi:putative transposase